MYLKCCWDKPLIPQVRQRFSNVSQPPVTKHKWKTHHDLTGQIRGVSVATVHASAKWAWTCEGAQEGGRKEREVRGDRGDEGGRIWKKIKTMEGNKTNKRENESNTEKEKIRRIWSSYKSDKDEWRKTKWSGMNCENGGRGRVRRDREWWRGGRGKLTLSW